MLPLTMYIMCVRYAIGGGRGWIGIAHAIARIACRKGVRHDDVPLSFLVRMAAGVFSVGRERRQCWRILNRQ